MAGGGLKSFPHLLLLSVLCLVQRDKRHDPSRRATRLQVGRVERADHLHRPPKLGEERVHALEVEHKVLAHLHISKSSHFIVLTIFVGDWLTVHWIVFRHFWMPKRKASMSGDNICRVKV